MQAGSNISVIILLSIPNSLQHIVNRFDGHLLCSELSISGVAYDWWRASPYQHFSHVPPWCSQQIIRPWSSWVLFFTNLDVKIRPITSCPCQFKWKDYHQTEFREQLGSLTFSVAFIWSFRSSQLHILWSTVICRCLDVHSLGAAWQVVVGFNPEQVNLNSRKNRIKT